MTCTILGVPKPYSTHWVARMRIRSKNGRSWKVSGSTGGRFPVVKPIVDLLVIERMAVTGDTTNGPRRRPWPRSPNLRGGHVLRAQAEAAVWARRTTRARQRPFDRHDGAASPTRCNACDRCRPFEPAVGCRVRRRGDDDPRLIGGEHGGVLHVVSTDRQRPVRRRASGTGGRRPAWFVGYRRGGAVAIVVSGRDPASGMPLGLARGDPSFGRRRECACWLLRVLLSRRVVSGPAWVAAPSTCPWSSGRQRVDFTGEFGVEAQLLFLGCEVMVGLGPLESACGSGRSSRTSTGRSPRATRSVSASATGQIDEQHPARERDGVDVDERHRAGERGDCVGDAKLGVRRAPRRARRRQDGGVAQCGIDARPPQPVAVVRQARRRACAAVRSAGAGASRSRRRRRARCPRRPRRRPVEPERVVHRDRSGPVSAIDAPTVARTTVYSQPPLITQGPARAGRRRVEHDADDGRAGEGRQEADREQRCRRPASLRPATTANSTPGR